MQKIIKRLKGSGKRAVACILQLLTEVSIFIFGWLDVKELTDEALFPLNCIRDSSFLGLALFNVQNLQLESIRSVKLLL